MTSEPGVPDRPESVGRSEKRRHDGDVGADRLVGRSSDGGYGLVALLIGLVVLGGVAAVVVVSLPGGTPTSLPQGPSSAPGVLPGGPTAPISTAAQQACVADYQMLSGVMTEYQAEQGVLPTSVSQLQPLLRGSLSTAGFSFVIDPAHPGQLQVRTPGHPATDGPGNCRYA